MQSPTPTMLFQPGRSNPSTKPRTIPQTGAVVKTRPVLAALVRLMPKVKAVWAAPMPKQPRPIMGRRSLRRSLLSGLRVRSTRRSKSPPPINRNATIKSWGRKSAAYFVAAKFMPQKRAAKIRATSVSTAALPFSSLTTRFYAQSTANARTCTESRSFSLVGLDLGEPVADAADGLDVPGGLGIGLYLPADVLDVNVGGAGLAEEVAVPEVAHYLLAAVDPSRVGGQERQDIKLLGRQIHGRAPASHPPAPEIHFKPRKLELLLLAGDALRVEASSSQMRPHPAHQLARTKRFRNVVVGADLEAHHHARLVIAGGEHQDGHAAARAPSLSRPDLAAHADAVHAREHHVQDDEVERLRLPPQALQSRLPVSSRLRHHTLAREGVLHDVSYRRVVLNYQYLRHLCPPPVTLSRPSYRYLLRISKRCSRPSSPPGPCRWTVLARSLRSFVFRGRSARRRRAGRTR